jgi:hypothetical protein
VFRRQGAIVFCDNTARYLDRYAEYLAFVHDPANGFRSMTLPMKAGFEISCGWDKELEGSAHDQALSMRYADFAAIELPRIAHLSEGVRDSEAVPSIELCRGGTQDTPQQRLAIT